MTTHETLLVMQRAQDHRDTVRDALSHYTIQVKEAKRLKREAKRNGSH